MDQRSEERFLHACRLLATYAHDATFSQLLSFSEYVYARPVRPLIIEARKVLLAFREACLSPSGVRLAKLAGDLSIEADSVSDMSRFYRDMRVCVSGSGAPNGAAGLPSDEDSVKPEWDRLHKDIVEQTRVAALATINADTIKAYLVQETARRDPLALGEIFEVLGHHAETLAKRRDFVGLIKEYVGQFDGASATLARA